MNHLPNKHTSLAASLVLTGFAATGTSVVWNGLPFIAKRDYGFGETENLALFVLIGFVYVTGALVSGNITQRLQSFISSRLIIAFLLATQTFVCLLPLVFKGGWVIWTAGGVAGACSSWLWPLVESYLVAGRHGRAMRRAIGWWNIVWMIAVACVMFAMAPLMDEHASMVIVGLGVMNLFAIGVLPWYGKNPIPHDENSSNAKVPEEYRALLRGARVLLPLSYIINGVLAPLLPFVLSGLSVDIFWQTPLASIWMIARVVVTAAMWHWASWHGKWSVLWMALLAMSIGLVCIFSAQGLLVLVIGLIAFGAGMGATYYAGLYYAMTVGRGKVGAGGTHEALIGGGYMVGPIAGLATLQFATGGTSTSFEPIVYVVLSILVVAIAALAMFWRKAR